MPANPSSATAARRRPLLYLTVLLAVLAIVVGAICLWSATDDAGTNVLSSDPQSTSPPAPLTGP